VLAVKEIDVGEGNVEGGRSLGPFDGSALNHIPVEHSTYFKRLLCIYRHCDQSHIKKEDMIMTKVTKTIELGEKLISVQIL
jgi:hypothetical protein